MAGRTGRHCAPRAGLRARLATSGGAKGGRIRALHGERSSLGRRDRSAAALPGFVDERQVRAAAGITLVLGAVAFAYAFLAKEFRPIRIVTPFFFLDFVLRIAAGPGFSPVGRLAGMMTRSFPAEWVSARPKRFAWLLGSGMSLAMTVITNLRITGLLPMSICLACLSLMWMEAVLGFCLGCSLHRVLVDLGWVGRDGRSLACPDGSCAIPAAGGQYPVPAAAPGPVVGAFVRVSS